MTLDLNTVLPSLCFFCGLGINDSGQIAGSVLDQFSFVPQAVILTPTGGGGAQRLAATGPAFARSSSQVTWEKAAQLASLQRTSQRSGAAY
jgi:hypothetical protein